MSVSIRDFPIWIMQTVALRESRTKAGDIVFAGNFQQIKFAHPIQDSRETDEEFRLRVQIWLSQIPRSDTFPEVLAYAYEAILRDGQWKPEYELLDVLKNLNTRFAKWRRWWSTEFRRWCRKHRIPWRPWVDAEVTIGTSKRARRSRRKRAGYTRTERIAARLRTGVARHKRESPQFDQRFAMWFGIFRWQFVRDVDCLKKTEVSYLECLARREAAHGPTHHLVGEAIMILARLCHEQCHVSDAGAFYRRAWSIWLADPTLTPQFREFLLRETAIAIVECFRSLPLRPTPMYVGPRVVTALIG